MAWACFNGPSFFKGDHERVENDQGQLLDAMDEHTIFLKRLIGSKSIRWSRTACPYLALLHQLPDFSNVPPGLKPIFAQFRTLLDSSEAFRTLLKLTNNLWKSCPILVQDPNSTQLLLCPFLSSDVPNVYKSSWLILCLASQDSLDSDHGLTSMARRCLPCFTHHTFELVLVVRACLPFLLASCLHHGLSQACLVHELNSYLLELEQLPSGWGLWISFLKGSSGAVTFSGKL
ncbi:hypothetical protein Bca52824_025321 [Brassica carinata]|uniref:Uncharacterized protein n=1 Tax=Brassica carinata TaxID=52824 RepID=A0A8X8AUS7_BRACI|nr:hypothetical protein Bca52824_025321 [Brassica carinata]